MKHFLNLERCTCGAYRYLAMREHKRSYEVYLIHHMHSADTDTRKYSKLASIPKYRLNIHEGRMNEPKEDRVIKITFEQSVALKSLLRELSMASSFPTGFTENAEDLKPLERIEILSP